MILNRSKGKKNLNNLKFLHFRCIGVTDENVKSHLTDFWVHVPHHGAL